MNETDTRAVLLMRAFEQAQAVSADDAAWAGREARRQLDDKAAPEAWLARRAHLGLARLAERDAALRPALDAAQRPAGARQPAGLVALCLLLGMTAESLGAARHINLLAMPLLGLLAWNAAVYAALVWAGLRRGSRPRQPARAGALAAAWERWHAWAARRLQRAAAPARTALVRFGADWLSLSAPLQAARGAAWLHAGAAALALGAVLAMYLRGLAFDYQAGWDSTFLQPAQVRQLLGVLLGPASAISGLTLPDAQALAGLRLSAGGGEGAAPWIHRWALTLLLAVVVPRAGLAARSFWRARRLAGALPLPEDDALRRLLLGAGSPATVAMRPVRVLPYSYQLDAERRAALAPALAAWLGPGLQCDVQPSLPLGAEDSLPDWLPAALAPVAAGGPSAAAAPPALLVLLFPLAATPERENQGAVLDALVRALAGQPAPRPLLRVAIDESGYRQRLAGPDGVQRVAQRRAAWEALLIGLGLVPGFIDLSAPVPAEVA